MLSQHPITRTPKSEKPCKWFVSGWCYRGENCLFSHDLDIATTSTYFSASSDPPISKEHDLTSCSIASKGTSMSLLDYNRRHCPEPLGKPIIQPKSPSSVPVKSPNPIVKSPLPCSKTPGVLSSPQQTVVISSPSQQTVQHNIMSSPMKTTSLNPAPLNSPPIRNDTPVAPLPSSDVMKTPPPQFLQPQTLSIQSPKQSPLQKKINSSKRRPENSKKSSPPRFLDNTVKEVKDHTLKKSNKVPDFRSNNVDFRKKDNPNMSITDSKNHQNVPTKLETGMPMMHNKDLNRPLMNAPPFQGIPPSQMPPGFIAPFLPPFLPHQMVPTGRHPPMPVFPNQHSHPRRKNTRSRPKSNYNKSQRQRGQKGNSRRRRNRNSNSRTNNNSFSDKNEAKYT